MTIDNLFGPERKPLTQSDQAQRAKRTLLLREPVRYDYALSVFKQVPNGINALQSLKYSDSAAW